MVAFGETANWNCTGSLLTALVNPDKKMEKNMGRVRKRGRGGKKSGWRKGEERWVREGKALVGDLCSFPGPRSGF